MSIFSELEKLVSGAIDTTMGERTRILRRKKGEYFSGSEDSSRPPLDIVGVVDYNPVVAKVQVKGQYDGFQPSITSGKAHVSYDIHAFTSPAQYPREHDEIVAYMPAPIGTLYLRVTRVDPDYLGRILCVCEETKAPGAV